MEGPPHLQDWVEMRATAIDGVRVLRAHFVEHKFDRHSHEGWSIGVTFDGRQTFRSRGVTKTSRRGNVVVLHPDEAHDGHGEDAEGFRYAIFYIPETVVSSWLREAGGHAGRGLFREATLPDAASAEALARAVRACLQGGESLRGATLLSSAVLCLFERHAQHRPHELVRGSSPPWLARVREYLEANYAEDVRVEALACVAGVSRVHLTRAFVRAYGLPPHEMLNGIRLRAAERLLLRGVPIALAAVDTGFTDQSHLTRRFKGSLGITPAKWLRAARRS